MICIIVSGGHVTKNLPAINRLIHEELRPPELRGGLEEYVSEVSEIKLATSISYC